MSFHETAPSHVEFNHLIELVKCTATKTLSDLVIFTSDDPRKSNFRDTNYTQCITLYKNTKSLFLNQAISLSIEKFKDVSKPQLKNFHTHDRIVLMDDSIWHFGATVGGLHFGEGLTAVSGPWPDIDGKMMELMNHLLDRHIPGVTNVKGSTSAKPLP